MADLQSTNLDVNTPITEDPRGPGEGILATPYFEDYLFKLLTDLRAINEEVATLNTAITELQTLMAAFTPTNVTPDRSFDADATTLDEIADVLGTLIADLQTIGAP